jgi:hypothetical protein
MIWFLHHPLPLILTSTVSKVCLFLSVRGRGGGGVGGGGAKSHDGEKAWFSINYKILSVTILHCGLYTLLSGKSA